MANMRWTTLFSILCCAGNFVMAFAILAIVSYNLSMTSTKEDRLPLPGIKEWRNYLTQLIPASVYIITASVVSCWAVTRRRKPYSALLVLLLHAVAVVVSAVYCSMIFSLIKVASISPEEVRHRTEVMFRERAEAHGDNIKWVPIWFIEVQSKSSTCCGIVSFRDWGTFWPKFPHEVPESCCRNDDKCITVIDHIEWPSMPSDYIKNDEGCARLIVETAKDSIFEVVKFLLILITLLFLSLGVFIFQYTGEFCITSQNEDGNFKRNITNLTIGETWARMGFNKAKPNNNEDNTNNGGSDYPTADDNTTQPSSYSDIYFKELNDSIQAMTNSGNADFADSNNSGIFSEPNSGNAFRNTFTSKQKDKPQGSTRNYSRLLPLGQRSQIFDREQSSVAIPFNFSKKKKNSTNNSFKLNNNLSDNNIYK